MVPKLVEGFSEVPSSAALLQVAFLLLHQDLLLLPRVEPSRLERETVEAVDVLLPVEALVLP